MPKNSIQVRLTLRNHGKTPAIVTNLIGGIELGDTAPDLTDLQQLTGAAGRVKSLDESPSLDSFVTRIPTADYGAARDRGESTV